MTEKPNPLAAVAPKDKVDYCIETHFLVSVLLLLTVVNVEHVLVLSSLCLHQARSRCADLVIVLYSRGHVHVLGEYLAQDGSVFEDRGSTLGQARQHRVAAKSTCCPSLGASFRSGGRASSSGEDQDAAGEWRFLAAGC
jgi:hypothetical protein